KNFDLYESEYEEVEPGILNIRIKGTRVFAVRPQDGINAATGMIDFLFQIDFLKNEIGNFCVFYLTKFGYSHDGSNIDCDFRDQISTPLTLSPDLFDLENNAITFSVHCRFPVTIDFETVISKIKSGIVEENVFISSERVSPAHYIPPDSKLVSSLMAVYRDFTGDSAAKPVTMEGGTYARMLKNAVAFGPLFPGEPQVAHSPNEYLNLDSIIKATKIYARSIYKLACD
ncbi:MAG: M20/M25/M40 family metallo-hydrolase, partial [Bacillota bacterium]|nr:M20/M25/M40 family metallo-hydrolase [Bacillota bacterium]